MRLSVLLALVLGNLGFTTAGSALAAGNCPGGQAYVDVHVRGTVTADREVCVDEVAQWHDLVDPPFRLRSKPGRDPQNEPNTHEALSIRELATQLAGEIGGFSVDSLTYVEIQDRNSSKVSRLRPADLKSAGANGFENSLMPAVFFQPGYGMFYIRPLRPDPQDVNVNDYLAGVENGPLHVYLHTSGEPLSPTIAVDRATAEVGQSSAFTVLFDPEATGNLEYNWNFGDGATSNKPAPQHPWTAAGTYRVYLNVARTGQLPSQSNILEITVKPKKVKPDPEPKDPKPTKGPTKGGKGDKHNPETGPDDSKGEHGDGTPSTDDDQDPGAGGQPGASPGASPSASPSPNADPANSDGQGTVTGVLLTSAGTSAQAGAPVTAPSRMAVTDPPLRLPAWFGAGITLAALLVLGGLSESTRFRRFLRSKSQSAKAH